MEFSYWDHEVKSDGSGWSADANNNEDQEILLVGRSYECVFCKRGFTTAQALGGHMNIHRKDKVAANKHTSFIVPSSSSTTSTCTYKVGNNDNSNHSAIPRGNSSYYSTTTTTTALPPPPPPHQGAYYFPAASSPDYYWRQSSYSNSNNNTNTNHPSSSPCVGQVQDNKVLHYNISTSHEDALDLELRLGHHHHHP